MLVTSIFSFSHNVFKMIPCKGHLKLGLYGKELIFYHRILPINDSKEDGFGKTPGEMAGWFY